MTSRVQSAATEAQQSNAAPRDQGLRHELLELFRLIPPRWQKQLFWLQGLMLLGALAEVGTIGAVIPFLALLARDPVSGEGAFVAPLLNWLEFQTHLDPLLLASILFATLVLIAGGIRLQLTWSTQNFVFRLGHELSVDLQRRILTQPYSFHLSQNSSVLLATLNKVQVVVTSILLQVMYAAVAIFLSLWIMAAVIFVAPLVAAATAVSVGVVYLLVSAVAARRLRENSAAIGAAYHERLKTMQESLGGIRDVIIGNAQPVYLAKFATDDARVSRATASIAFIAAAPRLILEASGMAIIIVVAYVLAQRASGVGTAFPILGAMVLGAQRLLPLVQQIYHSWANVTGNRSALTDVLVYLRLPIPCEFQSTASAAALPFTRSISLDRVTFSYPGVREPAIRDLTLDIPRGFSLGIIGRSGSGKTTLGDILMGLLEPSSGTMKVDGRHVMGDLSARWRQNIAHVPQFIFLSDATIAQNIAFSLEPETVDMVRVVEAARKAQLHDFVETLPDHYATRIGEQGIRLSGGQRQRLGIARAIYRDAPVIVLDEATSAVDETVEAELVGVLNAFRADGRTVIIISHRPSTVAGCDRIIRLADGGLAASGRFDELFPALQGRRQKLPKSGPATGRGAVGRVAGIELP